MKRVAIATMVMIIAAASVAAQSGGHIGLYADPEGDCCVLNETLYVPNYVYVVHTMVAEAQGVQFRVENAWNGPIVGAVTYDGLVFGDIFTGVVVPYAGCRSAPHLVATMSFIPVSPTPVESIPLWVAADPSLLSGQIEVLDCANNVNYATGGVLNVNFFDYTPMGCEGCWTTSAEENTWGKVKALYR